MSQLCTIADMAPTGHDRAKLAQAVNALERIERATLRSGDQRQTIHEIAADALAEIRDPATGKTWG